MTSLVGVYVTAVYSRFVKEYHYRVNKFPGSIYALSNPTEHGAFRVFSYS